MKIKVLGDRLLVKLIDSGEQVTAGGIVMPSSAQENQLRGEVVAVGAGRLSPANTTAVPVRWELEVKVGDIVFFSPTSGVELSYQGSKFRVVSEAEVYAVLESD